MSVQRERVLEFIRDYIDRYGFSPTVREIGEELGMASPSTVHRHLENLQREGMVDWEPGKPRTIRAA